MVLARLAPASWLRSSRRTARLRLTLLYGALFVLSGAILLGVTYLLVEHAMATVTLPDGVKISFGKAGFSAALPDATFAGSAIGQTQRAVYIGPATVPAPPTHAQMVQLQDAAGQLHAVDMHTLLIRSVVALGIMSVISVALGWLVAGRVLRPVRTISAAARKIGASNLHERLSLDGPDDEFRELAATLDELLERLERSFDSQRRFVANASHELRTPLTLDRALLERALRHPDPDPRLWRSTCERLLASSQHQDRLVEALLTLAKSEDGVRRKESFQLADTVETVLLNAEVGLPPRGPRVLATTTPSLVSGDPRLVERLVRNLVDNAVRYNRPQGRVDIAVEQRSGHSVLVVSNTGPPISPSEIGRLFLPFERLATSRISNKDGSGLGLSIVRAIADAHDARLTAFPAPDGGLVVTVTFPRVDAVEEATSVDDLCGVAT